MLFGASSSPFFALRSAFCIYLLDLVFFYLLLEYTACTVLLVRPAVTASMARNILYHHHWKKVAHTFTSVHALLGGHTAVW